MRKCLISYTWRIVNLGKKGRIGVLLLSVALVTLAHFATPLHSIFLHNLYQRLYYLPILAAAFWFGLRGAVLVALLSAACYLPHIVTDWAGHPMYRQAQFAELVMFQVVALVVGALAQAERRQRDGDDLHFPLGDDLPKGPLTSSRRGEP